MEKNCGDHHHHSHGKCHKVAHSKSFKLIVQLLITGIFFVVELVVGYAYNSMALVADSFHMLSDVLSLFVGLFAVRIAKLKTNKNTFGWVRAEVLGALINSVFLLALCFSIFVESLKRIVEPESIDSPSLVLVVGLLGLVINIIGLFLFHHHHDHGHHGHGHHHAHGHLDKAGNGDVADGSNRDESSSSLVNEMIIPAIGSCPFCRSETCRQGACKRILRQYKSTEGTIVIESLSPAGGVTIEDVQIRRPNSEEIIPIDEHLNMRGVFLHIFGDFLGSIIVCVTASVLCICNKTSNLVCNKDSQWLLYLDPGLSLLMVCIIMYSTFPLLRDSALILLQTVPTHIKVDKVRDKLLANVNGVLGVHEFHVWQLAGNRIIASAHVQCRSISEYMRIANQIKEFFHNEGIHSTTIQPEFIDYESDHESNNKDCLLECGPPGMDCGKDKVCCPKPVTQSPDNGIRLRQMTGSTSTPVEQ